MKKLACACTVLSIALACSACATTPPVAATPTPTVQTVKAPTIQPSPPPTSEPTPSPNIPPEAERAFMALAEGAALSRTFVDMPPDQVAPYVDALGGDYDVYGRTAGDDASYLIAVRRADAPLPEDCREISISHAYPTEDSPEAMTIQYTDPTGTSHDLYTIEGGYSVHPTRDTFDLQSLCIVLQPAQGAPDPVVPFLFSERGRARLAFHRANPAFMLENAMSEPHIDVRLQNEQTALFVSSPQAYSIALPDDAAQALTALLADAEPVTRRKRDTSVYGLVHDSTPDAYRLGIALITTGKRYDLYGEDGAVGLIAVQRGDGAWCENGDDVQLLCSEEAATALLDIVMEATGHDVGSFSPSWFDEPLASATLSYPNHVKKSDGTYDFEDRTQTIEDPQKLEALRQLLAMAVRGNSYLGNCPYVAPLTLTREDGETMLIMLANDGCDSMAAMGSIGFIYEKQADMREIFDEAMLAMP